MSGYDDFGGLAGAWKPEPVERDIDGPRGPRAQVMRVGAGVVVERLELTPLNLLQARKLIDVLIEQGRQEGHITAEHERVANELGPASVGAENVMPREEVDRIKGDL